MDLNLSSLEIDAEPEPHNTELDLPGPQPTGPGPPDVRPEEQQPGTSREQRHLSEQWQASDVRPKERLQPSATRPKERPQPSDIRPKESPQPSDVRPKQRLQPSEVRQKEQLQTLDARPKERQQPLDARPKERQQPLDTRPKERAQSSEERQKQQFQASELRPKERPKPSDVRPNQSEISLKGLAHQPARHTLSTASTLSPLTPSLLDIAEYKTLLSTVNYPSHFLTSPAVCAVKEFLPENFKDSLIPTAVRLYLLRKSRVPNAAELLELLDDADYDENNIVQDVIILCNSFGGFENVPYYMAQSNSFQHASATSVSFGRAYSQNLTTPLTSDQPSLFKSPSGQKKQPSSGVDGTDSFPSKTALVAGLPLKNFKMRFRSISLWYECLARVVRKERLLLRSLVLCGVCYAKRVEVTFLPCSHLVCCSGCASGRSECSLCKQKILAEAKTYVM